MLKHPVQIKLLRSSARQPHYATDGAAGMDLHADLDGPLVLPGGGGYMVVPTGIAIALPPHLEAQIRSRSGLAAKNGVFVLNAPGTIDSDYRGEIKVILCNMGDPFTIQPGDRIAQMVISGVMQIEWEGVADLEGTTRGANGFGSTGVGVK